jgi:hypothetical protein
MKALGWIVAIIGVFVLGPIWSGYVLSILWGWFIVQIFHVPQISIPLAIGIAMTIRMLTNQGSSDSNSKKRDEGLSDAFIQALGFSFLYPLLVLAMGAIVHAFV